MAVDNYARSLASAALANGGSSSYSDLQNKPKINGTELNGNVSLDALDIYSKQDVDDKMLNLYKYKGSVQNKSDLDNIDPQTLRVGDTYNVISTGMNYAWTGTEWDNLGSEIDLSNYYDKDEIDDKIKEIELYKFPNVTIFGEPTVQQGQISNFSATNYLEFPFIVDFRGRAFEINFSFTTGDDIINQQNILDSDFGLAFAIRDKHIVLALSYNGTSWALERTGALELEPQKTYRIKISWDGLSYKVQYSIDGGVTYINDITFGGTQAPYPKQMYIGVGKLDSNYFKGSINLNHADVKIAGQVLWQGMDDAGLATRADINLENITSVAGQKIKELAGGIEAKEIAETVKLHNLEPGLYKIINGNRMDTYSYTDIKAQMSEYPLIVYVYRYTYNSGYTNYALVFGKMTARYVYLNGSREEVNVSFEGMATVADNSRDIYISGSGDSFKTLNNYCIVDNLNQTSYDQKKPTVLSAYQGQLLNQKKLELSLSNINQDGIDKIKEIAGELVTEALESDY